MVLEPAPAAEFIVTMVVAVGNPVALAKTISLKEPEAGSVKSKPAPKFVFVSSLPSARVHVAPGPK